MRILYQDAAPHFFEELRLPGKYANYPSPPQMGDVKIYLNSDNEPDHPRILWTARIGKKIFTVFHPDKVKPVKGRYPRYRIDYLAKVTHPNRAQFEHALFEATDKALDEYYEQK